MNKALLVVGAGALLAITAATVTLPDHSGNEIIRNDAVRITQHLRTVEGELLARDAAGLSAQQRAARAQNLAVLREYYQTGVYPHNHDHPEGRLPYFRDEHGTLCAMAYLIWRSGETDLVDRVARTNNNAYIKDLQTDAQLTAWLERNGLTVAEAARIQPTYGPARGEGVSSGYATASALIAAAEGGVIAWNLITNPAKTGRLEPGLMAVVTGSFGVLFGFSGMTDGAKDDLGPLNMGMGAATATVGIVNVVRGLYGRTKRSVPTDESAEKPLQLTPVLQSDVRGRAQLGLNLRF